MLRVTFRLLFKILLNNFQSNKFENKNSQNSILPVITGAEIQSFFFAIIKINFYISKQIVELLFKDHFSLMYLWLFHRVNEKVFDDGVFFKTLKNNHNSYKTEQRRKVNRKTFPIIILHAIQHQSFDAIKNCNLSTDCHHI